MAASTMAKPRRSSISYLLVPIRQMETITPPKYAKRNRNVPTIQGSINHLLACKKKLNMYQILYRIKSQILEISYLLTFEFCSQVFLGTHRNQNGKEYLNPYESFLRKSQFSTLTDLNHGFGGPWDMLRIFFVFKCHLHNASKVFLPKKF